MGLDTVLTGYEQTTAQILTVVTDNCQVRPSG